MSMTERFWTRAKFMVGWKWQHVHSKNDTIFCITVWTV